MGLPHWYRRLHNLGAMCDEPRLSFQPLINLNQPMPLGRKLRLATFNLLKKVVTCRTCCGNHDRPGC